MYLENELQGPEDNQVLGGIRALTALKSLVLEDVTDLLAHRAGAVLGPVDEYHGSDAGFKRPSGEHPREGDEMGLNMRQYDSLVKRSGLGSLLALKGLDEDARACDDILGIVTWRGYPSPVEAKLKTGFLSKCPTDERQYKKQDRRLHFCQHRRMIHSSDGLI